MINAPKLHAALKAAGIPVHGCNSDGRIDFLPEATDGQREQAWQILTTHDPSPLPSARERYAALSSLAEKVDFLARRSGLID